jgi:hypothetical protein
MINFEEYSRNKIDESLKEGLREQWISRELRRKQTSRSRSGWLKNLAGLFAFPRVIQSLKGVEQPAILSESGC